MPTSEDFLRPIQPRARRQWLGASERFVSGAAIATDSPTVHRSLRKQPRGPRRKQASGNGRRTSEQQRVTKKWPEIDQQKQSYQSDEHTIQPSQDILAIVTLWSVDGQPGHEDSGRLLVKSGRDVSLARVWIRPTA